MGRGLLSGGVFRGAAIRDLEAEGYVEPERKPRAPREGGRDDRRGSRGDCREGRGQRDRRGPRGERSENKGE